MKTRRKTKGERRKQPDPRVVQPRKPFRLPPSAFLLCAALAAAALSGCGTFTSRPSAPPPPTTDIPAPPPTAATKPRPGGYYLDDGPGANPPADIDRIPDAVPRWEPLRPANARPYTAMGVSYQPMTSLEPYKARGLATWYGRRYHGKPTASSEPYDMYAMTAAHATLPIPSYARVTNVKTGSSVVVRVNDRGPFVEGRLIDVSYTAAYKLGILAGATMVDVESIIPTGSSVALARQTPPAPPRVPEVVATPPPAPEKTAVESPAAATAPKTEPVTAAVPAVVAEAEPKTAAPSAAVVAATGVSAPQTSAIAPAPVAVATAAQTPIRTEGGRVFLQLGAFGSRENADHYLARLKSQVDWLTLDVVTRDGLHRVQAGPYSNQYDARQDAQRLAQTLGIKPLVQVR